MVWSKNVLTVRLWIVDSLRRLGAKISAQSLWAVYNLKHVWQYLISTIINMILLITVSFDHQQQIYEFILLAQVTQVLASQPKIANVWLVTRAWPVGNGSWDPRVTYLRVFPRILPASTCEDLDSWTSLNNTSLQKCGFYVCFRECTNMCLGIYCH